MEFNPTFPDFPPDFVAWATSLRHRYYTFHQVNARMYSFTYAPPFTSRMTTHPVRSSITVLPEEILQASNWRQVMAGHIRAQRRHVKQQLPRR